MKRTRHKDVACFTHAGVKYEKFDCFRPYFVVRDGKLVSCHENYADASRVAPYSGGDRAGRDGGPAMTTNSLGLYHKGIANPIPDKP